MSTTPTTLPAPFNPAETSTTLRADPQMLAYTGSVSEKLRILRENYAKVDGNTSVDQLDEMLNYFKDGLNYVMNAWKPFCQTADSLHNWTTQERGRWAAPFVEGVEFCTGRIKSIARALEEEKRRLEAEAQKAIEAEKKRLAAEAEQLMRMGQVREADQITQQAEIMLPPALPAARPKMAGTTYQGKMVATVEDVMALLKAIVEGKVELMQSYRGEERPLIIIDDTVLQEHASKKGTALNWPGVTVKEDFSLRRKARR